MWTPNQVQIIRFLQKQINKQQQQQKHKTIVKIFSRNMSNILLCESCELSTIYNLSFKTFHIHLSCRYFDIFWSDLKQTPREAFWNNVTMEITKTMHTMGGAFFFTSFFFICLLLGFYFNSFFSSLFSLGLANVRVKYSDFERAFIYISICMIQAVCCCW